MAKPRIRKKIEGVLPIPIRRDSLPANKTEKSKKDYDRKKEKEIIDE